MSTVLRSIPNLKDGASQHDGDSFFDMRDSVETSDENSRSTLVYMSPADFLRMVEDGLNRNKEEKVADLIRHGVKFISLPLILFEHDDRGHAQVVGHEGRHRARALQGLKIGDMPVILRSLSSENGRAIRWGSQTNKQDRIDRFPTILFGQRGSSIAMPRSVVFPR